MSVCNCQPSSVAWGEGKGKEGEGWGSGILMSLLKTSPLNVCPLKELERA